MLGICREGAWAAGHLYAQLLSCILVIWFYRVHRLTLHSSCSENNIARLIILLPNPSVY